MEHNKIENKVEKLETDNTEYFLTQWSVCLEMANAVSQRRDTMNNLFVTLHLAIVSAISFDFIETSISLMVVGIACCLAWFFFIRNYRLLNKAKFEVINKLEEKLPVKPFCDEWEILKEETKYIECSKLELFFPITFLLYYLGNILLVSPIYNFFLGGK